MKRRTLPHAAALGGLLLAGVLGAERFVASPSVVSGRSMQPTLDPGDRVLVDLWTYRHRAPRAGELVLFRGPGDRWWIKRVAHRAGPELGRPWLWRGAVGDTWIWVEGDNAADSRDSRAFGAVPARRIRGRVVLRFWPPRPLERPLRVLGATVEHHVLTIVQ